MDVLEFIRAELLGVLVVLWGVGLILKKTPKIPDWTIPYILAIVSISLCGLYIIAIEGISLMSLFTAITQGLLIGIASVGGNQLIKQIGKKDKDE